MSPISCPPYETDGKYHGVSAALEFGVGVLKVKHIVILGHAHCGGIRAYAEDAEPISPGDFIGRWMSLMAPAAEKVGARGAMSRAEYLERMEQASVVNTLDNLMTFPRLRTAFGGEGRLSVLTGRIPVSYRITLRPASPRHYRASRRRTTASLAYDARPREPYDTSGEPSWMPGSSPGMTNLNAERVIRAKPRYPIPASPAHARAHPAR